MFWKSKTALPEEFTTTDIASRAVVISEHFRTLIKCAVEDMQDLRAGIQPNLLGKYPLNNLPKAQTGKVKILIPSEREGTQLHHRVIYQMFLVHCEAISLKESFGNKEKSQSLISGSDREAQLNQLAFDKFLVEASALCGFFVYAAAGINNGHFGPQNQVSDPKPLAALREMILEEIGRISVIFQRTMFRPDLLSKLFEPNYRLFASYPVFWTADISHCENASEIMMLKHHLGQMENDLNQVYAGNRSKPNFDALSPVDLLAA
jgi:hypothetical protein